MATGRHSPREPELKLLEVEWDSESPIPEEIQGLLAKADSLLQSYWDSWHRRPIEQYVACDFRDVWRAMQAVKSQRLPTGNLFCEWGCGFGIVTAMASKLGWDAVGIEAEAFLVQQAQAFLRSEKIPAEIWHGNFLPNGAERLAKRQANHASLFHKVPCVYDCESLGIDDFGTIFAYPWPGEDYFLKDVFRLYAADRAILVMFLGPYELEIYRKVCS
ncbi:MAG: class I SAM-dependent methyltransferase [Pirellula sp.]|jgi:SAM-dependent methyltransferase